MGEKKVLKYMDREIGFASFFGILTGMIIFFTKDSNYFRIIGLLLGGVTFALTLYSLVNMNKKRKIIKNMNKIEKQKSYETHSKLYFILNNMIFHEIIQEIDGRDALLGIDEMGIFTYLEDKNQDRQGHRPSTKIKLDVEKLNITFKTLKYNRYLDGEELELDYTFREPESKYKLTFDTVDNKFLFQNIKN